MNNKIENVTITNTFLGIEDHGILTFMIYVQGDGWGQGFGGYNCKDSKFLSQAIQKILDTLEVKSWEDLMHKGIRIRQGDNGSLCAIGHFIKDQWYNIQEHSKKFKK